MPKVRKYFKLKFNLQPLIVHLNEETQDWVTAGTWVCLPRTFRKYFYKKNLKVFKIGIHKTFLTSYLEYFLTKIQENHSCEIPISFKKHFLWVI